MRPLLLEKHAGRPGDRRGWLPALAAAALLLPLAGCLGPRTHAVDRTLQVDHVLDATVAQLLEGMQERYVALHTLSASVQVTPTEGGEHSGQVKEIPTFAGALFVESPSNLRLQLRLFGVRVLDMVGDGKNFKAYSPPRNLAFVGSEIVTKPSANALENLRPSAFRDALLIPPIAPDEYVTETEGSRVLGPEPGEKAGKHQRTEEPDYDLSIARVDHEHVLARVRVIHIGRTNLLPYKQDIYQNGKIVETVIYDHYQKVSGLDVPMSIFITRPLEEFTIKLEMSNVAVNPELAADAFTVNIPAEGVSIHQM